MASRNGPSSSTPKSKSLFGKLKNRLSKTPGAPVTPPNTSKHVPTDSGPSARQNSVVSTTSSATTLVAGTPPPAKIAAPSATPTQRARNTWTQALEKLSPDDRRMLIGTGTAEKDHLAILDGVLAAAIEKQELVAQRRWKVTICGKQVVLRDVMEHIVCWVEKFKAVGDVLVQIDPVAASPAWGVVRFLLQVAIDDVEKTGILVVAIEKITNLINRCEIYESLHVRREETSSKSRENLTAALIQLYAAMLQFLVDAKKYLSQNTAVRSFSSAAGSKAFDLTRVEQAEGTVSREFDIAEAESRREAEKEYEKTLRVLLGEITAPLKGIGDDVSYIRSEMEETKRNHILNWYSAVEYANHHLRACEGRVENTGEWLLQHDVFKKWDESSESTTLWLHGIPGSGKTKLASAVIDFLTQRSNKEETVVYHYCNKDEKERSDIESIMRCLIRQFAYEPGGDIEPILVEDFKRRSANGHASGRPTLKECGELLKALVANHSKPCYVVIDALDESNQAKRRELLSLLLNAAKNSSHRVQVFITSRDENDIVRWMSSVKDLPSLYLGAGATDNAADVERYVRTEIDRCISDGDLLNGDVEDYLRDKICDELIKGASGMFLWCKYSILHLCEYGFKAEVLEALSNLPKTMEETYSRIYENILRQKGVSRTIGVAALSWIAWGRGLLTVFEFLDAIYVDIKQSSSVSRKEISEELVERCSGYMLVVDKQAGLVRPAHLTVTEFMKGRETSQEEEIQHHLRATKVCLRVLGALALPRNRDPAPENGLKTYAIVYWISHLQWVRNNWDEQLRSLLSTFFGTPSNPSKDYLYWYQEAHEWQRNYGDSSDAPLSVQLIHITGDPINPLCAAANWGLFVPSLWDEEFDANYRNNRGETLLYLATTCHHFRFNLDCGHVDIVRRLLERGADANAEGGYEKYALANAIASKDLRLVDMLVKSGARTDVPVSEYSTALQLAVSKDADDVVQLLIDQGANVNFCAGYYQTALQCAAGEGKTWMVELLLDNGADPNIRGGKWNSAIEAALVKQAWDIATILLKAGADVTYRVPNTHSATGTPLIAWAHMPWTGDTYDTGEMIDTTVLDDITSRLTLDEINGSACSVWGSPIGNLCRTDHSIQIIEYLLEHGFSPNIEGGLWGSPVGVAAYHCSINTLLKLSEVNASFGFLSPYYGTPLHIAGWSGRRVWNGGIVNFMVKKGIDVNRVAGEYGTAIQCAAANGNIAVLKGLLEAGADVNIFSDTGYGSPLQAAISTGRAEIEELLRLNGAQLNPAFDISMEPRPSRWHDTLRSHQCEVSDDGLTVTYGTLDWIPATILSNHPIPLADDYFYFELEVLPLPTPAPFSTKPRLTIGLCTSACNLQTRPGILTWSESWGYHSDDGVVYASDMVPEAAVIRQRGPKWGTEGDVVGMGVMLKKRLAFYTKNGQFLGIGGVALKGRLYPAVGMSTEASVRVNFGEREFKYRKRPEDEELTAEMVGKVGIFRVDETAEYSKWG